MSTETATRVPNFRYHNPDVVTPFQKTKTKDIAKLHEQNIHPLDVQIHVSTGSYRYNLKDIYYYYESINTPFAYMAEGVN